MSNLNPNTIQDRAAHIMKCFGQDINIQKGGEGSRGGRIIGHTRSGKPIYDTFKNTDHKNFTQEDLYDAMQEHSKIWNQHREVGADKSEEAKKHLEQNHLYHAKDLKIENEKRRKAAVVDVPKNKIESALKKEYDFTNLNDGSIKIQIKNGQSYPWFLKKKDDKYILSQHWSEGGSKPVKYKKGESTSKEDLLMKIAKEHNKATAWMGSWKRIE